VDVGDPVFSDEIVRTGADSATKLVFRDSTNLAVGPKSRVVLDRFVYDPSQPSEGLGVTLAKGVFRFTVATDGVAGHASMPAMGENALLKMAPILERLGERQPSYSLTEESRACLRALGEDPAEPAAAVAQLRASDPLLATYFEPMLGVTFTPTRIRASEKINVIPSRAELRVDCRVPPGLGEDEVRAGIFEVLGEGAYEIEFTERVAGNRSPGAVPSSLLIKDLRETPSSSGHSLRKYRFENAESLSAAPAVLLSRRRQIINQEYRPSPSRPRSTASSKKVLWNT